MLTLRAGVGPRHTEWWLLAAAVVVSVIMPVAPIAMTAGVGIVVWAAILIRRRGPRCTGALIATIVIPSVTLLTVGAVGVATFLTVSTPESGITLIQGHGAHGHLRAAVES